jgi:RNA-directed DNA polymerase
LSKLSSLKSAKTLADVAGLLGFSASGLSYVLYKQPHNQKYTKFDIPKKSGGTREINAPLGALKGMQKELADLLYACREELAAAKPRRALSHGFRKGQSIIDNAKVHTNRRYVLNLDLADFFPTFNFGRVRGFFLKDRDFELNEKVATILAQIACCEGALPQGSPCSPIIADMVAHVLDVRLVALAKEHRVTYSRYADDLTFSTSQKDFPVALATGGSDPTDPWALGSPLVKIIERAGFAVNPDKTRMQVRASRQLVTGLSVNVKANIPQDYWRSIRSMCRALFTTGTYYRYVRKADAEAKPQPLLNNLDILGGMLSHVYHVKKESGHQPEDKTNRGVVFGQKLHEEFWFYRYFVALERPILVCEGKTDNIYIRNAIRRLAAFHPKLGADTPEGFKFAVGLFSYQNKAHQLVRLGGGMGDLMGFIRTYRARLKAYKFRPLLHPVIILVDNDTGLTGKFCGELAKMFNVDVSHLKTDTFYHLTDNLYLVKTPEGGGADGHSCIEDLFEDSVLKQTLDGKAFHTGKDFDPAKHVGKAPFAEKIVAPSAGSIDWAGFAPLLARVVAVLDHYKAPGTAPAPVPLAAVVPAAAS